MGWGGEIGRERKEGEGRVRKGSGGDGSGEDGRVRKRRGVLWSPNKSLK